MNNDSGGLIYALLAAGPAGAGALYWAIYRYYRNTNKSHDFEHETLIDAEDVEGSSDRVNHISKTRDSSIDGDNQRRYRDRVQRVE